MAAVAARQAGMFFLHNADWNEVQKNLLFAKPPTSKNTKFSHVYISTRIAKEFEAPTLSEWVQALDNEMAVACVMAVKDLKTWYKDHGAEYLTWDRVQGVFNNCDYVVKDIKSSKRIAKSLNFDDHNFFEIGGHDSGRKAKITTWFRQLFNDIGEQAVLDNSDIVNEGAFDRLANLASEIGVSVDSFESFFGGTDEGKEKVMEIGVIRFPTKDNARIKLFRLVVFAWFQSKRILAFQHDQSGFEVEYDSVEFRPNTSAIDTTFAAKAKAKLADPDTFNF